MKKGLLGKKLGMTQVFTGEGDFVPVTAIEAGPCPVLKVTDKKVTLGFGDKKEKNMSKPKLEFFKKLNVKPRDIIKEFLFDMDTKPAAGQELTVDIFKENDFVDITGTSKGKGFQGGVKRWHWRGGPGSHGSTQHRKVGSIGGSSSPSRVWKGQKFPGRMGNERKTVQDLQVIKIYKDKNIMLVKGPVPGANNGYLEIRLAKKKVFKEKTVQKTDKRQGKKEDAKKKG